MNLTAVIAWVLANQELTTFIVQQIIFAVLAGIFRATGQVKVSKFFGTLTTCDMGRVYNWLRDMSPKVTKLIKLWSASIVLFVVSLGCAGTLEEAKLAGAKSHAKAALVAPATVPLSPRCQSLSDRETYFTGGGIMLAGLSAAAAGSSLALKSDDWDTALQLTAGISAVGAGGLTWFGSSASTSFARECQ